MMTPTETTPSADAASDRPVAIALSRGLARRCPCCGKGALYRAYLKPREQCSECGEDLRGHRADDLPPYLTILIAGHLLVPALVALERTAPPPMWMSVTMWSIAAIALCLLLLPPVKGAVIGLQWALRMHGFDDGAPAAPDRIADPERDLG